MSDKPSGEHLAEIKHYRSVAGRKGLVTEYVEAGSASAEFLYRMEQRRQAARCRLAIDMRGKVPGACAAYEFQGLTHYLDAPCLSLFEQALSEFGGVYTVGVFERVTQAEHSYRAQELKEKNERARHARLTERKASAAERLALAAAQQALEPAPEVEVLPFGYSAKRKETRLTYITAVTLYLGDKKVPAKTSDLSLSGLKLRLAQAWPLAVGQRVGVHFTALEESENFAHAPVPYRIVKLGEKAGKPQVFVQRQDEGDTRFAAFLGQFIEANQRRYGIDLEDTIMALKASVYGQLYAQVLGHLPFFLREESADAAALALYGTSACNRSLLQNPACAPGEYLVRLLRPERLAELVRRSEREEPLLIFAYTGLRGGRTLLYSAAEHEFPGPDSRAAFLARGRSAGTLRAYLARLKPLALPDAGRIAELTAELSARNSAAAMTVAERFAGLSHAGALFEVSEQFALAPERRGHGAEAPAALEQETDDYLSPPGPVARVRAVLLGYRGRRGEERFVHSTEIEMVVGGQRYSGVTVDFSVRGIKFMLTKPVKLPPREPIKLSLSGLAKRVKDIKLTDLPYQLVAQSEDGLTLSVVREERSGFHTGSEFFRKLIEVNRDKLAEELTEHVLLAEALWAESLIGDNLLCLPFVVNRDAHYRHWLSRVGISEQAEPLLWFFRDEAGEFDFSGIGSPTVLKPLLGAAGLINEKPRDAIYAAEAYVFKNYDPVEGRERMHGINSLQLQGEALKAFVAAARDKFEHRFLRVQLMAAPDFPDAEYDEELQQIRVHARHRASQLHEEFHGVVAFGELLDVSGLIAAREAGRL